MRKWALIWLGSASLLSLGFAAANAADLSGATPVVAPPPAKISLSDTFTTEFGEDFRAVEPHDNSDWWLRFDLAHAFDDGWSVNMYFQPQRDFHDSGDKWKYYTEGDVSYKVKLNDYFSLTPKAGIGYVWGDTGVTPDNDPAVYYAFYLAGDLNFSKNWTWNAFNVRYRNAFEFEWETPKVTTGITYTFNDYSSLYVNAGYGWKNGNPDKISFAVGGKIKFP